MKKELVKIGSIFEDCLDNIIKIIPYYLNYDVVQILEREMRKEIKERSFLISLDNMRKMIDENSIFSKYIFYHTLHDMIEETKEKISVLENSINETGHIQSSIQVCLSILVYRMEEFRYTKIFEKEDKYRMYQVGVSIDSYLMFMENIPETDRIPFLEKMIIEMKSIKNHESIHNAISHILRSIPDEWKSKWEREVMDMLEEVEEFEDITEKIPVTYPMLQDIIERIRYDLKKKELDSFIS